MPYIIVTFSVSYSVISSVLEKLQDLFFKSVVFKLLYNSEQ